MEIEYLGANCLKISTKNASIYTDPIVSGKEINTDKASFVLVTNTELIEVKNTGSMIIDTPGEYEISGLSVKGIHAQAHLEEADKHSSTIYKIIHDEANVVIAGHIFTKLSDEQLEEIGMVDILVIPVGGNGYTVDATGAAQLTRKIEPKIVVPVHYSDKSIKYPVPQAELKLFLDEMGVQPEQQDSLKISKNTILPEQIQVVVLKIK